MKLINIHQGQAVRLTPIVEPIGGIYMPQARDLIKREYQFLQVPMNLDEWDLSRGITFGHGSFDIEEESRSIVIDKLQIFFDGIIVQARSYTEDADLFIDQLIEWSASVFGTITDTENVSKTYNSIIDIELDSSILGRCSEICHGVAIGIESYLKGYGDTNAEFHMHGLTMSVDDTKTNAPIPGLFRLERKNKESFDSNLYFSAAPLRTRDHLALLEELESRS